ICLKIAFLNLNSLLAEDTSIKIGALLCQTGVCSEWGVNALNGAKLAVEEINQSGGIDGKKLELLIEDTREENSAFAISAYKALRLKKISYFIGPSWSAAGLAIAPIVSKDRSVIMISPSIGVPEFNETGDNIFSLWPHDRISTEKLAEFAFSKGWKKIGILSSQQPWESQQGRVFKEKFLSLGGEITALLEPLSGTRDLKIEVLKLVNSKPNAIFISNFSSMDVAAQEISKLNYTGEKILILVDKQRLENSNGTLDGSFVAMYPEASNEFKQKFFKKFEYAPTNSADTAYDAVKLLYHALTNQSGNLDLPLKEILLKTNLNGAAGYVNFDSTGAVAKNPVLNRVENQNLVEVNWN
ncbi:MAG: ABC transporter substrate-binding protein, partial [Bdellovibrionales bacterium]|nr:ABC transporter substrate-binding protein [Bdellovibrionales bacterium]